MAPTPPTAVSLASTGTTTLLVVVALLVIAALMALVAVWLIRATRRDPPALAPLERMGDRSWRKGGVEARAATLAAARPRDAAGPAPMIEFEPEPAVGEATTVAESDTHEERVDTVVTAAPSEADESAPAEAADAAREDPTPGHPEPEPSAGDDGEPEDAVPADADPEPPAPSDGGAEDEDGPGYARTDG